MATRIKSFSDLKALIREDHEYAWSVHCNIAMPILDELACGHQRANHAAARVMSHLFNVDMTKHDHWESLERQWRDCRVPKFTGQRRR
jgi:hypothetical protein